jgi:hypothetical protein
MFTGDPDDIFPCAKTDLDVKWMIIAKHSTPVNRTGHVHAIQIREQ